MTASADHIKALVCGHAAGDESGFYSVALQMAAGAARLDALISKYMGETSGKLRVIFDATVRTRAVYLFDGVIAYAPPDSMQSLDVLRRRLSAVNTSAVSWDEVANHVNDLTCPFGWPKVML